MTLRSTRLLKAALFVACLWGAGWLVWAAETGSFSADPLADITHETGIWALRFLCITLAITPLRRVTGWHSVIRFRRMFGLFAFFYGTLHLLIYIVFDRIGGLDMPDGLLAWSTLRALAKSIAMDVYKRPFITMGMLALASMVPLAATSTAGMIRRLGGRRWQLLHRLVYVSATAAVIHYWWLVKSDITSPLKYGLIVALLLGFRVVRWKQAAARLPSRVGQKAVAQ